MTTNFDGTIEATFLGHANAMESTCNDPHACNQLVLPELSRISDIVSTQREVLDGSEHQLKIYLRVRPFSGEELSDNQDQGCVVLENDQTVLLKAPKGSVAMKSSERGIGQALHKFSFSQVFGPETKQENLFEGTVQSQVTEFLQGMNMLIFSYGVTNAGKSYTIQGSEREPGILPRALDMIFQRIKGRQYEAMDRKPYLGNQAQNLDHDQVGYERSKKVTILNQERESVRDTGDASDSSMLSAMSLSFSVSYDQTVEFKRASMKQDGCQYALWVAFFEIYNECIYDLLQPQPSFQTKRRNALRLCEDSSGNSYVRELTWINIQNSEEAGQILRIGSKYRSAASTKMNQSSSRSHSIFTMKLLKINGSDVVKISEISFCDLAGSERCNKAKTLGDRLKEAGNINTSLLTLGKCITAVRNHQIDRVKNSYIPFRESKLTRLFQSMFCGKGRASMIVNINQCASTYDETLHVMKFSAIAKQIVQVSPPKSVDDLATQLVAKDGRPLVQNGVIDNQAVENYLFEEELLNDDMTDISLLTKKDLLNKFENLKTKLLTERRRNLVQEIEIRKEMGDAMLQQLVESEELRSRQMAELKESYQEKMENTFEMYKDALKEHAYQCAMDRMEDDYVSLDDLIAEQEKTEKLKHQLSAMVEKYARVEGTTLSSLDKSCQTDDITESAIQSKSEETERVKLMYKEICALEKLCWDKQQEMVSLDGRLTDLNVQLKEAKDLCLLKSADIDNLQENFEDQAKVLDRLQKENVELKRETFLLKEKLAKLSPKSPMCIPRLGLLANFRESVTSPRRGSMSRTLKKSVKTTSFMQFKPSSSS